MRRKSKLARVRTHPLGNYASRFEYWQYSVQREDDPDRRDVLVEYGQSQGWVGPSGEVLDPNATTAERFNAAIRAAARHVPDRLRGLVPK
jgi:hypothetical protein